MSRNTADVTQDTRHALEEQELQHQTDVRKYHRAGWILVDRAQEASSHAEALQLLQSAAGTLEAAERARVALAEVRDQIHALSNR